jgi:N utilization substance protein B
MSTRRDAREWAVQLLFQIDLNATDKLDEVLSVFWADKEPDEKSREYAEFLVKGVLSGLEEIDALLTKYAENWDINRMGVIDRNVLRLALFEMHNSDEVPSVVTINEAVDLAKYFNSSESGKFVNGILDRVRKDLEETP